MASSCMTSLRSGLWVLKSPIQGRRHFVAGTDAGGDAEPSSPVTGRAGSASSLARRPGGNPSPESLTDGAAAGRRVLRERAAVPTDQARGSGLSSGPVGVVIECCNVSSGAFFVFCRVQLNN